MAWARAPAASGFFARSDARSIQPLFPFGHRLSYTTFSYANLVVGPAGQTVDFDVTNTSSVAVRRLRKSTSACQPQPSRNRPGN